MKHIMKQWQLMLIAVLCVVTVTASCSDDDPAQPGENLEQTLESVSTEWGCSETDITNHMHGYVLKSHSGNSYVFENPETQQYISYTFTNGALSASAVIFPAVSAEQLRSMLKGSCSYIGECEGADVYAKKADNLMITLWQEADEDGEYSAIGYTPINSELYETVEPIGVETGNPANIFAFRAEIPVVVHGIDKECEVGVVYGMNPDLPDGESRVSKTTSSQSNLSFTIKGLIGEETYYYRSYILVDKVKYYGEVKQFIAAPMTYSFDGREFRFVKVEGGPYGTFSIMQTEVDPCEIMTIAGTTMSEPLVGNSNPEQLTSYELRKFIGTVDEITGLYMRLPTSEEWQFAFAGGSMSRGYEYSGSDNIGDVAWYSGNSEGHAHPLGLKGSNELGLYDMSGNYSEMTCEAGVEELKINKYGTFAQVKPDAAYGGNSESGASSCKKSSHTSQPMVRDITSPKYNTIRLVVNHHPNAMMRE